jgi:hypothetical protein
MDGDSIGLRCIGGLMNNADALAEEFMNELRLHPQFANLFPGIERVDIVPGRVGERSTWTAVPVDRRGGAIRLHGDAQREVIAVEKKFRKQGRAP